MVKVLKIRQMERDIAPTGCHFQSRQVKPKTCKACRNKFVPERAMQSVCDWKCGLELQRLAREKKAAKEAKEKRAENREAKKKLKRRGDYVKEAQAAFNAWVRARDAGLPCISCGRGDGQVAYQSVGGSWDAGHYRSVGSCPELRFEPLNVHKQCKQCNNNKSGNVVEYRINLVKRIGKDKVEWLEGPHEPKKYTIEQLEDIKRFYRQKTRDLTLR